MNKKVIIGVSIFLVLCIIIVGATLGILLNKPVSTSAPSAPSAPDTSSSDSSNDEIEISGSMVVIYDKVMYKDYEGSHSAQPNAPLNSLTFKQQDELPTSFSVCFPVQLNVSFSDEMIKMIANLLDISEDCITSPGMNVHSFIRSAICGMDGESIYVESNRKLVSVTYPYNNMITDSKIEEIVVKLNEMMNSKDYIILNIAMHSSSNTYLTLLFYIIDSNNMDLVKTRLLDEINIHYNVVYGGYTSAVQKYQNACMEI